MLKDRSRRAKIALSAPRTDDTRQRWSPPHKGMTLKIAGNTLYITLEKPCKGLPHYRTYCTPKPIRLVEWPGFNIRVILWYDSRFDPPGNRVDATPTT